MNLWQLQCDGLTDSYQLHTNITKKFVLTFYCLQIDLHAKMIMPLQRYITGRAMPVSRLAASQLVTRSTRHLVDSSHGQLVTGRLVTRSTRHAVDSSQRGGQLVTSKQTSKHQSRTAAAVITLTCSPRSPPLLKKYTRIEQKTKWIIKHTRCDRVNLRPLLKPTSL